MLQKVRLADEMVQAKKSYFFKLKVLGITALEIQV